MSRKPRKPYNPAKQRRQAFEAIGLDGAAADLAQNQDVEIIRSGEVRDDAGHTVDANVARRLDAFEALKESMRNEPFVGCYDAARRLERDTRTALNEHDRGRPMERVDNANAAGRLDRMVEASRDLVFIRARLNPREWWLFAELINPTRDYPTWRHIVARLTGEENANAQGAAVRAACMNLRDAYDELDVVRQRAA